ncbi:hypothetical protein PFISCL1PPCAC_14477 [Pristionchus fissidentatus]|uniref:glutathione transferase n=1 Tax=Pristionchus fissidentatus TaxID=1538716 RepID=A0AAV5VUI8_9BILA|nr:hypothetical protein PFISCL1PPCAC_14477 [Pristionchus fissidentatus]
MPTYKLTYFPFRGRAEVARQLFHLAGVPFEDNRVKNEDWPALKATMPFGQMPLLEVDGKPLPQSFAIFRYLAKEFGTFFRSIFKLQNDNPFTKDSEFVGNTPFESAWIDAVADEYRDYFKEMHPVLAVYTGVSEGDKEKLVKEVAEPARDKFFGILEKIAKNNCNGHFIGSSLTWVDLLIAEHVHTLLQHMPKFLDAYPFVVATCQKIEATPQLKEWIEKRPVTSF